MTVQTHRTIIFEEFDKENPLNLFTILNNNPAENELLNGIEKLTVHNFNEFMSKFAPKVYEICRKDDKGMIHFLYTTDLTKFRGYQQVTTLDISDHKYYKMLLEL